MRVFSGSTLTGPDRRAAESKRRNVSTTAASRPTKWSASSTFYCRSGTGCGWRSCVHTSNRSRAAAAKRSLRSESMTQLGIMIEGQEGLNWERWRNLCRDVEALGFASLRRSEHLISLMGDDSRDCIDCWTSLALAAEWTKKIQFGPMVSPMTFHQAAVLARQAASVDVLSKGRLILGVGAGWNEREHEMFGVPFLTLGERMDLFEQGVERIRDTWAKSNPKPAQNPIPLLMGGVGEKRALPLAAREAAEWNYTRLDHEEYRHKRSVLNEVCKQIGRDPATLRYSVMVSYIIGRDKSELRERAVNLSKVVPRLGRDSPDETLAAARQSMFVGTPDEVAEQIKRYAKLGVELFMLQHFLLDDRDALELLASDVIPAVA